jgi:hypothetical protein
MKHLVAKGNPFDGVTLYGPFDEGDDALEWAEFNDTEGDWWIVKTTEVRCDDNGEWIEDDE